MATCDKCDDDTERVQRVAVRLRELLGEKWFLGLIAHGSALAYGDTEWAARELLAAADAAPSSPGVVL